LNNEHREAVCQDDGNCRVFASGMILMTATDRVLAGGVPALNPFSFGGTFGTWTGTNPAINALIRAL
jgi:hypothetical protein